MALSFEELYEEHKNLVYNLALNYVQNKEDAEEITQDVFVAVYRSLHKFQGKSSPTTWLYRITINKSLDFIKGKKRKKRFGFLTSLFHEETQEVKFEQSSFDHPGIQLEQKEAMERLFSFINELPEKQKTALILHKIEEKTQKEISTIMNISAKAVESLIQRAKQNLKKKLE